MGNFTLSPGVAVKETNLTNIIPAVSTSIGAFAGAFRWGPMNEVTTVTSEKDLLDKFGAPTDVFNLDFFVASYFLKYGNNLKLVRASNGAKYAVSNGTATDSITTNTHNVYGKYPGTLANKIKVEICSTDFDKWGQRNNFDRAPDSGEVHIIVYQENTVLETFAFLKTTEYKKKVNNQSKYITFDKAITLASSLTEATSGAKDAPANLQTLSGGTDGTATSTKADSIKAYNLFKSDEIDISLIIGSTVANMENEIIDIAEGRKDCVAFISPPITESKSSTPSADVITWAKNIKSSSYAFLDSTSAKVYDIYNDDYIDIPLNSSIAGLCAQTDNTDDAWFSPAGYNRGSLKGITKLYFNPNQSERDNLYKERVNPIVTFPGQGTILFGDKTATTKPSAFDRINVRRLFVVLEKAITIAAKYQLFEFNDEFTRAQFRSMVEPFLRDVKGRRGMTDFAVICDGTNNTPAVIDSNNFKADIYIKPNRSINFIGLNFVATRTGVSFNEVIGK